MNLRRLQKDWEGLARRDPLWAVLSHPSMRGNRWDPDEFFQTGLNTVAALLAQVDELGIAPPRRRACDFGCGVGRLTQALAHHFDHVVGVDIAPSMIQLARDHNQVGDRCVYVLNERPDLGLFEDDAFDFVMSLLVLQHIPRKLIPGYISELVRVLAPGGVLVFQLPARQRAARYRQFARDRIPGVRWISHRLLTLIGTPVAMVMVPREEVVAALERAGGAVVAALDAHDHLRDGYLYFVTR